MPTGTEKPKEPKKEELLAKIAERLQHPILENRNPTADELLMMKMAIRIRERDRMLELATMALMAAAMGKATIHAVDMPADNEIGGFSDMAQDGKAHKC